MRRLLSFLKTDDLPPLSRTNYVAELRQMSLWGIVAGTVEGSMASVIASKTFEASALLTSIVWALPILMNVLNVVWSTIIRGHARRPAFFLIALCGLGCVASVGLTSAAWGHMGVWIFAGQIGLTHLFLTGLITLRTTMWKVNYPTHFRAQIAGRLQTVRMLLSVLTTAALSLLFNYDPESYRLVYPAVAVLGALSLIPMRRLRMRGEKLELRQFQERVLANHGARLSLRRRVLSGLAEAADILRTDRLFARYMVAQFLLGAANFFTDPILVVVLTKRLDFDYFSAQAIMYLIPISLLLLSIQFWARFFDRVGVLRFRIYNSACWVTSYVCVTSAMVLFGVGGIDVLIPSLLILALGRVFNGLGRGGGKIAWNLGHLHFAGEHQTELYMGIHVALTGLRALCMPIVGWFAFEQFGMGCFAIAVVLAGTAHVLFRRMAAADQRQSESRSASDEAERGTEARGLPMDRPPAKRSQS